jgi:hypothetical protein
MRRFARMISRRTTSWLLLAATAACGASSLVARAAAFEPGRHVVRVADDQSDDRGQDSPADDGQAVQWFDDAMFDDPNNGLAGAARNGSQILKERIASINLICKLTADQGQKLELAGKGDIQRELAGIEMRRKEYQRITDAEFADRAREILQKLNTLRKELAVNRFGEGSLFDKTIERTLTADQAVRFAPFRRVRWLGRALEVRNRINYGPEIVAIRLSEAPVVDDQLVAFRAWPSLKKLSLDVTQITDAGLVHLGVLKRLEELDLSGTKVEGPGLIRLKSLQSLQMLDLKKTQVTGAGLENLAGLPKLKTLRLGGTPVTDPSLEFIKPLKNLRSLSLRDTRVTDEGLPVLAGLQDLHQLDLDGTAVTDAGLKQLAPFKELRMLDLRATRVTDAGLAHLAALDKLQYLCLFDTQVTPDGVARLKEKLPGLRADR